jgi:hypothetical protein
VLENTKWKRIIMEGGYDFNNKEKPLIIQFLQKKQTINNSLPDEYRIKVETVE